MTFIKIKVSCFMYVFKFYILTLVQQGVLKFLYAMHKFCPVLHFFNKSAHTNNLQLLVYLNPFYRHTSPHSCNHKEASSNIMQIDNGHVTDAHTMTLRSNCGMNTENVNTGQDSIQKESNSWHQYDRTFTCPLRYLKLISQ
jgi:hypothetical protein